MNKRILSFLLAMILVIATGAQTVVAAPKEAKDSSVKQEKEVYQEDIGDLDEIAVPVEENGCDMVVLTSDAPYKVFKFVPEETKEYFFFSYNENGDPYAVWYEKIDAGTYNRIGSCDDYETDEFNFDLDFGGKNTFETGKEYYFLVSSYDEEEATSYYFAITSDFTSREAYIDAYIDAYYGKKTLESVSFNNVPRHIFYDYETIEWINPGVPVDGMEIIYKYTDGAERAKVIDSFEPYRDAEGNLIGVTFDAFGKTYMAYWETLKWVDEYYFMDETVENALCIEEVGGDIVKYPVEIRQSSVKSIAIKSFPYEEGERVFINSMSAWESFPINLSGTRIEVTENDGTTYEFYWEEESYEDEDGKICGSFETDAEVDKDMWLSYSLQTDVNEAENIYILGDNSLTFSYGGKTASVDLFLYTIKEIRVTPAFDQTVQLYPFDDKYNVNLSLNGKTVNVFYTDDTTESIAVNQNVTWLGIQGNEYDMSLYDGKFYLGGYEVGEVNRVNIPVSSYPQISDITPGVPVTREMSEEQKYVIFRFMPEVTREYKFFTTDAAEEQNDTYGYICSDTECLFYNDDIENLQEFSTTGTNFGICAQLEAGTTYYLVARMYSLGEEGTIKCHLDAVGDPVAQVITAPATIVKNATDPAFALGARARGNAPLTYSSSNPAVATVDTSGTVTIKGAGTTTITIFAAATQEYQAATKQITLTVNPVTEKTNPVAVTINAPEGITKAYGSKAFSLNAVSNGTMTYSSSNTKVATVGANGKVTVKNCGKAVITIKATADGFLDAEKKVVINVVPKKAKLKSVKSTKAGQITVKWTRQKEASGYIIEYSTDKNFKKNVKSVKVTKNKTTSKTMKKLKKGKKYYVRVKAYVTIDKKAVAGAVSAKKNVKIKK